VLKLQPSSAFAWAVVLGVIAASCASDPPPPLHVPPELRPEDATFRWGTETDGPDTYAILQIRSTHPTACDDASTTRSPLLKVTVRAARREDIKPGAFPVGVPGPSTIALYDKSTGGCPDPDLDVNASGSARAGTITLDEVTSTVVRGSFHGSTHETGFTPIDLDGSFVAAPCNSTKCP
jgi:hypothetical protein